MPFIISPRHFSSTQKARFTVLLVLFVLPICAFSAPLVPGGAAIIPPSTALASLVITSSQVYVRGGEQCQLTATLGGVATQKVTWSVGSGGTISKTGLYTAPSIPPSSNSVTITATTTAIPLTATTITIPIWPAIPTISSTTPASLALGTVNAVSVSGVGLQSTTTVTINGSPASFTVLSPTLMTINIPVTPWADATQLTTIVASVDGNEGGSSGPWPMKMKAPAVAFDTAVRFLKQAGFGANAAEVAQVQQLGLSGWIDQQLQSSNYDYSTATGLQPAQWYRNSQNSSTVLRQRVTLELTHIYVTGDNGGCFWGNCSPRWENTIEADAFANASKLLADVSFSQIMGVFLNNAANNGGVGLVPNQNFAREIMQLMTIGPNQLNADGSNVLDNNGQPVAAYTQDNIVGMSAALSGWLYPNMGNSFPNSASCCIQMSTWALPLVPTYADWHAQGAKNVLPGVTLPAGQGAVSDMNQVQSALFNHPNFGPFLSLRLIQALVKSNPSPAYIARMSGVFANDGTGVRGNLGALVKAILLDKEARLGDDPTANDSTGGHLMEPVLYISSIMNTVGGVYSDNEVTGTDAAMGEQHWNEPNVFSYFEPAHQLSDGTPAPEEQLMTSSNLEAGMTSMYGVLHNSWGGFAIDWSASPFWNCSSIAELLDRINHYALHGIWLAWDQGVVAQYLAGEQSSSINNLIPDALYLAVSSSSYKVIR